MLNYCKDCKKRFVIICRVCEAKRIEEERLEFNKKQMEDYNKKVAWGQNEINEIEQFLNEHPKSTNRILAGFVFKCLHPSENSNIDCLLRKNIGYER